MANATKKEILTCRIRNRLLAYNGIQYSKQFIRLYNCDECNERHEFKLIKYEDITTVSRANFGYGDGAIVSLTLLCPITELCITPIFIMENDGELVQDEPLPF